VRAVITKIAPEIKLCGPFLHRWKFLLTFWLYWTDFDRRSQTFDNAALVSELHQRAALSLIFKTHSSNSALQNSGTTKHLYLMLANEGHLNQIAIFLTSRITQQVTKQARDIKP
jgi:hypothetical protein